ncbi:hypothetical protein F7725_014843 [Dissostichus mawsoni]|uniref:C2H2-type domain-containing protein n=1 Tax=Dissostichus mawsoni TaxID=36200 RepID=A0A7J5YFV1_DISMA|nr:hypothetical protein F7725_014843 [Dissostichus mawsoni]
MDAMSLLQPFLPPPAFLMPDGGAAAASSGSNLERSSPTSSRSSGGRPKPRPSPPAPRPPPADLPACITGLHQSLPAPPPPSLFKTPSSSSAGAELGDAHTPLSDSPPASSTAVHEEAELSGRKPGAKAGSPTANGSAANGSAANGSTANGSTANGSKGSYPCRFCEQTFSFSGVLQAHMRFHLGIVPHQCNICDYVAPDKATLIRHLRTHSGERPYVCRVCHYPFTVKANCERHLRKKHGKTSGKTSRRTSSGSPSVSLASPSVSPAAVTTETEPVATETLCRFCGDSLQSYRSLQIHLRTHNGCSRKPYECRRCGAAFLAKRNCIHHLLKQHPEVQEREIERHISTLLPPVRHQEVQERERHISTLLPPVRHHTVKQEETDQPLDFSRGRGGDSPSVVKQETPPPPSVADQPIDLSVSKRRREIKLEPLPPLHPHPQLGCYQLPPGSSPLPPGPSPSSQAQRLKPLLPKPPPSLKELPPLASIAQIISSVSGATDLLKPRPLPEIKAPPPTSCQEDDAPPAPPAVKESEDTPETSSRKRPRKRGCVSLKEKEKAVDQESELSSVEKILANTDANKFSNFLQSQELGVKRAGSPTPSDQPMTSSANSSPAHNQTPQQESGPELREETDRLQTVGVFPPVQDQTSSSSEGPEKIPPPSSSSPPQVKDYKHVCRVCKKSFRYATTLARHERAHLSDEDSAPCRGENTLRHIRRRRR